MIHLNRGSSSFSAEPVTYPGGDTHGVKTFARHGTMKSGAWCEFARHLHYQRADFKQLHEIRNKNVDVLIAVHPMHPDAVHQCVVSGPYGQGQVGGKNILGYRKEGESRR